ncbi:thiol S-methyltransferase TMT1A-like [Ambystoma mexicanum]|uniref:thiol S-methyltransferase TMT1A-like n=1 Tax=Ambystoma mexicanum TaxID=8296 RepID=UPI0037E89C40
MGLVVVVLQFCVGLLALPAHLLDFLGLWKPLSQRIFPYIMRKLAVGYNEKMHSYKKELFRSLPDFAGPSGQLKVLEIGCGTGNNFQFYPQGTKVTCTDLNPNFQQFLKKSQAENDHLHYEPNLVAPAENLSAVEDASVDVVVSTLVLCSAENVERVLKEVRRILRRGGAFYFMEHVCADHSTWTYFFQQIYHPTWKFLLDGCNLCREIWKDLEKASFSEMKLKHIWAPFPWKPFRPHILGYAVK